MVYSGDAEKARKEAEAFKICGCGEKNPKFSAGNGIWFCENCLKSRKEQFDKYLEKFLVLAEEYDLYNEASIGLAERSEWKIRLLK